jgi:hypothetical protein
VLAQLAHILVPIYGIVLVGFVYAWVRPTDLSAPNRLNLDVFTPALLFDVLAAKDFALGAYLDLALAGALVIFGCGAIALAVARLVAVQPRTLVPPMMFLNSGNMGLPLAVLAFGEHALAAAVVLFLVENLLHFTLGIRLLDRDSHPLAVLRIPLVLACLLGLTASLLGIGLPEPLAKGVHWLGQIAIPLMLFALGARLKDADLGHWRIGLLGALLRPLSGLVVVLPLLWLIPLGPELGALLILFALLPPAVLNYIFAERYRQEPAAVAAIVIWGNLASLLVIPVALLFLLNGS